MLNINFREGITEVLDILHHMEYKYVEKIPKSFMDYLEENKLENYETNFDHSKSLNELNLKEETKNILGIIYSKFWCNNEEKAFLKQKLKENEEKYQEKLRTKYNPNNVFKKNEKAEKVNLPIVLPKKHGILKKIMKSIKNLKIIEE